MTFDLAEWKRYEDETAKLRAELNRSLAAIDAVRRRLKRSEWIVGAEIERILEEALGDDRPPEDRTEGKRYPVAAERDLMAALEASLEPLGTCAIHGDYWTDDCVRCRGYAHPARPPTTADEVNE